MDITLCKIKEKERTQKSQHRQLDVAGDVSVTKKIDRAHRSHSTREATKQNETKKNQELPNKTIKSHDSMLVRRAYGLWRELFDQNLNPSFVVEKGQTKNHADEARKTQNRR